MLRADPAAALGREQTEAAGERETADHREQPGVEAGAREGHALGTPNAANAASAANAAADTGDAATDALLAATDAAANTTGDAALDVDVPAVVRGGRVASRGLRDGTPDAARPTTVRAIRPTTPAATMPIRGGLS